MKKKNIIFAITGTNGAGKGTIADILKKHGAQHVSFRDYFTQECLKQGLEPTRDNLMNTANALRGKYSGTYIVEQLLGIARSKGVPVALESIRAPEEVDFLLHQSDVILVGVDAPQNIRYERILARGSSTDSVSFEEFCEQERKEMSHADPTKQNIDYCLRQVKTKFFFENSQDITSLENDVESRLVPLI